MYQILIHASFMGENDNGMKQEPKTSTVAAQPKIRGVTTTLDYIDFGTSEQMEAELRKTTKERKKLPDSVSSRALYSDIIRIAWPSLAELLLTSLVSMFDMMMVGSLGAQAISAVGLAIQPRFLMMTTVMALNTGATAIIARARGAGQHERASDILRQAIVLATVIALICSAFGTLASDWMIAFMSGGGMEEATIKLGSDYFKIQSITFVIPAWSFCITAALRGTGNSKPCMVYNIIANILNIIGNYLLINGHFGFPRLGVNGAAIATVFAQAVGTVLAFACVFSGKYYLKLRIGLKTVFKFDRSVVSSMAKVGLPAMLEQLVMRAGVVAYSLIVANLGETDFATHNICLSIQSLSLMNGQAFAVSATSLAGQSLGKQRLDMAEHYGRRCRQCAMSVSIFLAVLFVIFRSQLIGLYNSDTTIIATGSTVMLFIAVLQPFQSSQFVLGGILRGAGDTKYTAFIILITTVFIRTSLGYLFVSIVGLGLLGAWFALIADQLLRTFLFMLRYNQGKWKKIKL